MKVFTNDTLLALYVYLPNRLMLSQNNPFVQLRERTTTLPQKACRVSHLEHFLRSRLLQPKSADESQDEVLSQTSSDTKI
jgi:hypothetical protein